MLTAIRNKATSWVVKILFGVLILAFGAWGIGDIFTRQDLGDPVLTVDKANYTAQQFRRDLERRLEQMQRQGLNLTAEQFAQLGGVAQIVEQAADRLLLDAYAERSRLTMPQSAAIIDIQRNPSFAGLGGTFDRDRFLALLQQSGMNEGSYVEAVRGELTRQQIMDLALAGTLAPMPMVERLYAYRNETRTAETLVIPDLSMTGIGEPDAKAIEAFYKEHEETYRRPEYRTGQVAILRPEDFVAEMTVTEDEVKSEFESRQAEFSTPEIRAVQQIVVQDESIAKAVTESVQSGKSFADAVKSSNVGEPVDLGAVTKDQLPKDIAEAAFALGANSVSAPLKSAFGWHVVYVGAITPAVSRSLDEVKDQIRQELALAKAGDSLVSVVNQLDDAIAGGEGLAEAAKTLNVKTTDVAAIDPQGKDRDGNAVSLPAEVLGLLQATDVGATSQIEALQDGSYAVVQVTGSTPSEIKPLSEVESQVKTDWLNDARRKAADAKAKELQEKLKSVGDLSVLATDVGQAIKVSAPFRRDEDSQAASIDRALAGSLYALKVGEAAIGRTAEGAVLARLTAIIPAKLEPGALKTVADQTAKALSNDMMQQFFAALEQQIPVTRHDEVVQRIVAPQQ
jgi:peptidyl-prolyl cis-trans isomerase D